MDSMLLGLNDSSAEKIRVGSMVDMRFRPWQAVSCIFARARQSLGKWDKHLGSAQHLCISAMKGGEGSTVMTEDGRLP